MPTPKCVVFYNGEAEENERYEIRLSEAFANKEVEADAELVVHVYNVNAGHNEDILRGYLMKHRNEVLGSLLTDFDQKKYERTIYEDGVLAGTEQGIAIGTEQGIKQSIENLASHYMSEDPALSEAEALDKAKSILCTAEPV